jgi:hypothetical protein
LFWVFVAFGFEVILLAAGPLYPLAIDVYVWLLALNSFVPIMLAYAILRHHVFDITFTVNRAIAYTLLALTLGLGIGLLDWAVEGFIGSRNTALALEALVAVAFGMGLDRLRRHLERFIDRAIFRERHAAERQVQRVIASLSFADSYEAVGAATIDDVAKAVRLASAALFLRQDDRRYRRVHSYNWLSSHCSMLTTSDSILRVMHAELAPIRLADLPWDCDGPAGMAMPAVAIPLVARNELLGVLLYGTHTNGLSIDPGEIELLAHLGRSAANALDNVEARVTRAALEETRRKLAALQNV